MATAQQPAAHKLRPGVPPLRAGQGTTFFWRKLHSLLGVIPIGAFFLEHLLSNFEALKGPAAYGAQVKLLNSLPLVRVLEWTFIFLPILYHGVYGVYIWLRGKANLVYYPWAGNWMYMAQRYTGLIAILYIGQHVVRQRFMGISLPENPYAAFHKVQVELSNPWMVAVYVIAMIAICWHFSYGVWLFAAKWGITPGKTARKRFGIVCAAMGIVLLVMGLASIWAFVGGKYPNVPTDSQPASTVASTISSTQHTSQSIRAATLQVGTGESGSLPAPQGSPILFAANEHLDLANGSVRRTVLEYPRTIEIGWAPDGEHFFVNDEVGSNITEISVFDREGNPQQNLQGRILRTNSQLKALARTSSHMYFEARRWIDVGTLEVEVSGHTDSRPFEEFDKRFLVTLQGAVTQL